MKGSEKEKEKERREEGRGGEGVKEKPEDSQLSTLSDDDIIVRATYISPVISRIISGDFCLILRMRINAGEIC